MLPPAFWFYYVVPTHARQAKELCLVPVQLPSLLSLCSLSNVSPIYAMRGCCTRTLLVYKAVVQQQNSKLHIQEYKCGRGWSFHSKLTVLNILCFLAVATYILLLLLTC